MDKTLQYFGSPEEVAEVKEEINSASDTELIELLDKITASYFGLGQEKRSAELKRLLEYFDEIIDISDFTKSEQITDLISFLKRVDGELISRESIEKDVFDDELAELFSEILLCEEIYNSADVVQLVNENSYFYKIKSLIENEFFSILEDKKWDEISEIYLNILIVYWLLLKQAPEFSKDVINFLEKTINNSKSYNYLEMEDVFEPEIEYYYIQLTRMLRDRTGVDKDGKFLSKALETIKEMHKNTSSDIIKSSAYHSFIHENIGNENNTEDVQRNSISKTEQLLGEIETLVSEIREKLVVVSPDDIPSVLGHYTGVETTLQYLIKENLEKSYLRLTHSRQLNDPMEGKALFDYLGVDASKTIYTRSNIYLSSMSTAKDSLPMWKEYGDSSKGVFLEYESHFLNKLIENDIIEFAKVCYLSEENSEQNPIFEKLTQLKNRLDCLKNQSRSEYVKAVTLLSRILYLFKVAEYSYEEEYRILINFDDTYVQKKVNRTNSEDKTQDIGLQAVPDNNYKDFRRYVHMTKGGEGIGLHVYINEKPLKYSNVVLGPKVKRVDYIAPYLQLIDQDLTVELSKIPYR